MGAEPSESAENVLLAFVLVVARFCRLEKYRSLDIFASAKIAILLLRCKTAIGTVQWKEKTLSTEIG
jgi:hypothetical protein